MSTLRFYRRAESKGSWRQSRIVPATSEVVDEDIAWRECIVEASDRAAVASAVIYWTVNAVEGNLQLA